MFGLTCPIGALVPIISLASVALSSPMSAGEAGIPAALKSSIAVRPSPSLRPHIPAFGGPGLAEPPAILKPRYDYEPGDSLERVMCFCTQDNSLEQLDTDPTRFYNGTPTHQMGTVWK